MEKRKTTTNRLWPLLIGVMSLIIITSCKGSGDDTPAPTDQEIAQAILENTWIVGSTGSISVDNTDVTDRYDGFSLNIGNGTYTTTNAGDLFPASGTWEWVGETDNIFTTGNGKEITITELTETQFSFQFLKTEQNVAAGISGNYSISLTAQ